MNAPRDQPGRSANKAWLRALERSARAARDPTRTLCRVLEEVTLEHGTRGALLAEEGALDYSALLARACRYARWGLARGFARGAVIALVMDNHPDYFAAWLGLSRAGLVVALVNPQLRDQALQHAIALVAPEAVVVGAGLWDQLHASLSARVSVVLGQGREGAAGSLEDELAGLSGAVLGEEECAWPRASEAALYIYTSGTTGLPKAARVSHARVLQWSEWFAGLLDVTPEDRMYDCLPMYHSVGGVVAVGAMMVAGASVVVRPRFSASHFWSDIARWECTLFQYIGELCRILVDAAPAGPVPVHRLRAACGNGLSADVWSRFQERFAIPQILEFYAATEANFSLYNVEGRIGSIGRVPAFLAHRFPVALVRFDVDAEMPVRDGRGRCIACAADEVGEAISPIASDPTRPGRPFEGYTDAAATAKKVLTDVFEAGDAWYRSGDLMRRDAAGFFYFVDRVGDTFRWKGENVATGEVAAALCRVPGILDAQVYGVKVPGHEGRAGMAALVVSAGFAPHALEEHLAPLLPVYARPVFIRIARAFELTGTFKPRKQDLVRQGFAPEGAGDSSWLRQSGSGPSRYVAMGATEYQDVLAGRWRL